MHKKHTELNRQEQGLFGKKEIAILGTTCEEIAAFVANVRNLFPAENIAYADADHNAYENGFEFRGTVWQHRGSATSILTPVPDNSFSRRAALSHADLVMVNGNHFEAKTQLIICNPEKEASLRKRKTQLTNVKAIILPAGTDKTPAYISELTADAADVVVLSRHDMQAIRAFFLKNWLEPAPLKALVMAGGKSTRMGIDKTQINHHGIPQVNHLVELLGAMNIETYVSCREDQQSLYEKQGISTIKDRLLDCGPLGGIISAFMHDAGTAWLVVACDVPLLDRLTLDELIRQRNHSAPATSFRSPYDGMPEPLIAIWEPKAYPAAMQFIAQGYSCPRKVLMNTGAILIEASEPSRLMNVNTPDDLNQLQSLTR